ncbi:MAG: thiamine-phosphate kinase [Verrucomicrobiales bacterium]|nr:thiamine-phosphate kinase [Verrucomicrobiales bacterium]|tara:strand:- start:5500 stop:6426 length:927 start_codon:yes stop_codon:yes gene_type:complete
MSEAKLIRTLTQGLPSDDSVHVGPGDDCAVISTQKNEDLCLFKTDAIVEGIHFTADTRPELIGRKAIARPLSDIAAMSGYPTHALITLGLPKIFDEARLAAIYQGAQEMAAQHDTFIVGGETTRTSELLISVSLIGRCDPATVITRAGSQTGDAIFVTGELGGSLAGKHLDFMPRLQESHWLSGRFDIHAMIDLSDGLATDLHHLLNDQIGAELLTTAIPISKAAKEYSRANPSGKTPLLAALTDGEDYELLFTLPAKQAVSLHDEWKQSFRELPLKCIGKITRKPGISLRDENGAHSLNVKGYDHLK